METQAIVQEAQRLFAEEFLCAESVLLALARSAGHDSPLLPRIATGFCSGMGRAGGLCGAVSGAVMAFGLCLGRDKSSDDLTPAYALTEEFQNAFMERFGGMNCRELTGFHLGDPEGLAAYRRNGLKDGLCRELVGWSCATAMDLLQAAGVRFSF